MVANQDDSGDENSKTDNISSESKKRDITTPHTPQIPFTANNQGYSFSPTDTRYVKQRIILPVPTSNYDSTYNYNSLPHGPHSTADREEIAKAMLEYEKSNRGPLFSTEESRDKVIMPVPSNESVGETAVEWDESIIVPETSQGTESTETRLWPQPHREAKLGTQKLIMPVHDSSAKDEEVSDQLEHDRYNSTEMNTAAQVKSETVGVTSSEIEKPLVTGPLQSETDINKQPMELKSMMGEQSNLKESVQNNYITQFLYNKEYTSFEEPAGYEIKDLDAYIEDFADDNSPVHSSMDKSQMKTEQVKPLESLDKKEKGKADLADKASLIYSKQPQEISAADKSNVKTEKTKLLEDFADEATLMYSKEPQKISAADKGHVYAEKPKPPESLDKKEKEKADLADKASLIYSKQPQEISAADNSNVKTEKTKLLEDFADEATLIYSKEPQKISAADKGHVYAEKAKPLESLDKKEKVGAYAHKPAKTETQDLDTSIKDFADEDFLIHSKQPYKIPAADKSHVKTDKIKPSESGEKKEKAKAYSEITYKQLKSAEKPEKSKVKDLDPSIKDIAEGASQIHSKHSHKILATDKSRVIKTVKVKPRESWEEKEKEKAYGEITKKQYKSADKPAKSKTQDIDLADKASFIDSKQPHKISAMDKSYVKTEKIKPLESMEKKEKGKADNLIESAKEEKTSLARQSAIQKDTSVKYEVSEGKRDSEIQRKVLKNNIKEKESNQGEPKRKISDIKRIYTDESSFETEKQVRMTDDNVSAIEKYLQQEISKVSPEKVRRDKTGPMKGGEKAKTDANTEAEVKTLPSKHYTEQKVYKWQEILQNEDDRLPYTKSDTTDMIKKRQEIKKAKGELKAIKEGSVKKQQRIPYQEDSPPKETKASAPKEIKASPPLERKGYPAKETKGSPPKETKASPPKDTKGSSLLERMGYAPKETKGSPPKETKGFPPKDTSPSGAAKPDKHTSFDKYSSGKNEPKMHSSVYKYTSGTNESDKQTPVDKYYTRENEPNKHSAMHPEKPDHINLTVPVSHFSVTDKKDTKLGSHKSQNINQQNEVNKQSSKTITQSLTPNLPTESTTRQGVTSQSITLLDSPPRYLVKDIKESEVTKPLGGKLQPVITQNTMWPVHKLSSVNAKYLGKQATPWGDAGTFFPWVTYAAQKKSYQSYILAEQSQPNNQGNGPGSGPGSGSQIWQFLGRQYGVFKDNFNNHTIHGRANVAKATLLAVGVFTLWQMIKPKKSELTFQRCSECGAITPFEKRR